jgi:hypothetical protein
LVLLLFWLLKASVAMLLELLLSRAESYVWE